MTDLNIPQITSLEIAIFNAKNNNGIHVDLSSDGITLRVVPYNIPKSGCDDLANNVTILKEEALIKIIESIDVPINIVLASDDIIESEKEFNSAIEALITTFRFNSKSTKLEVVYLQMNNKRLGGSIKGSFTKNPLIDKVKSKICQYNTPSSPERTITEHFF